MVEQVLQVESSPLSQGARLVDTFTAPSRTFTDILRNASWWLPYLLLVCSTLTLAFAIQQRVGWKQLANNEIRQNPKAQAKQADLTAGQIAAQEQITQKVMQTTLYAAPVTNLFYVLLITLVLWPTINFGFAGSATFSRVFAVTMYASLPGLIKALLAAAMLLISRAAESFTMETMLGSNPGYYLEQPGPLKTLLDSLDLFTLWTLVLLSLGLPIVAKTKKAYGFYAVFGWFAVIVVARTAFAAV